MELYPCHNNKRNWTSNINTSSITKRNPYLYLFCTGVPNEKLNITARWYRAWNTKSLPICSYTLTHFFHLHSLSSSLINQRLIIPWWTNLFDYGINKTHFTNSGETRSARRIERMGEIFLCVVSSDLRSTKFENVDLKTEHGNLYTN